MTPGLDLLSDTGQLQSPTGGMCWMGSGGRCRFIYRKLSYPFWFFSCLGGCMQNSLCDGKIIEIVGLVSFWTFHSHVSFLQTAAKGRRSCWPEHSLAAGLESGYCHNRKLFATWVPKSELCMYHFSITPKKITRHRFFRELMVWIWQAMSPSQQSYESSTGAPAYTFCAATHTSWCSEELN